MKQVIVQLATSPTKSGQQNHSAFVKAQDFGSTLQAIHPQSDDAALSRWFTAQVDNASAAKFVETLRSLPEVSAAYVKPRAAPP